MPSANFKLDVRPILNPEKCDGYPPAWISHKPALELNFFINKSDQIQICDAREGNTFLRRLKTSFSCITQKKDHVFNEVLGCSLITCGGTNTPTDTLDISEHVSGSTSETNLQAQLNNLDTSKPVILICHGFLSWRNQMLLSNLAARLSEELACHTLRFDFTGNGHSSGTWQYANYEGDLNDLSRVVRFVEGDRNQGLGLGCKVSCMICHSQASVAMVTYRQKDPSSLDRLYVNLAGRLTVPNDFSPENTFTEEQCKKLDDDGEFQLMKKGNRLMTVTRDAIHNRNAFDILAAARHTDLGHMLTIHGSADKHVPVKNAFNFHEVVPNHSLHIIEGADHNFNGLKFMNDLVSVISSFVRKHQM